MAAAGILRTMVRPVSNPKSAILFDTLKMAAPGILRAMVLRRSCTNRGTNILLSSPFSSSFSSRPHMSQLVQSNCLEKSKMVQDELGLKSVFKSCSQKMAAAGILRTMVLRRYCTNRGTSILLSSPLPFSSSFSSLPHTSQLVPSSSSPHMSQLVQSICLEKGLAGAYSKFCLRSEAHTHPGLYERHLSLAQPKKPENEKWAALDETDESSTDDDNKLYHKLMSIINAGESPTDDADKLVAEFKKNVDAAMKRVNLYHRSCFVVLFPTLVWVFIKLLE